MGFHGGLVGVLSHDEEQDRPLVTRELLLRVGFRAPHLRHVHPACHHSRRRVLR